MPGFLLALPRAAVQPWAMVWVNGTSLAMMGRCLGQEGGGGQYRAAM